MNIKSDFEFQSSSELMIWSSFPRYIKWRIIKEPPRKKLSDHLQLAINASSIIDCCTYIEGAMNYILSKIIYCKYFSNRDKLYLNLLEREEKKLDSAQWREYCQIFEILNDIKLKDSLELELYDSINVLFVFRNMIIHGNNIEIEQYEKKNGKTISHITKGRYEKIFTHLRTYKLIKTKREIEPEDMLASNIIQYFFKKTLTFIEQISLIPTDNEQKYFNEIIKDSLDT